jgi:hypothetical protein
MYRISMMGERDYQQSISNHPHYYYDWIITAMHQLLSSTMMNGIRYINIWSDNSSAQFKNTLILSWYEHAYTWLPGGGPIITVNYHAAHHGHGVADAAAGRIKVQVRMLNEARATARRLNRGVTTIDTVTTNEVRDRYLASLHDTSSTIVDIWTTIPVAPQPSPYISDTMHGVLQVYGVTFKRDPSTILGYSDSTHTTLLKTWDHNEDHGEPHDDKRKKGQRPRTPDDNTRDDEYESLPSRIDQPTRSGRLPRLPVLYEHVHHVRQRIIEPDDLPDLLAPSASPPPSTRRATIMRDDDDNDDDDLKQAIAASLIVAHAPTRPPSTRTRHAPAWQQQQQQPQQPQQQQRGRKHTQ